MLNQRIIAMHANLPSRTGASVLEPYAEEIISLKQNHSLTVILQYLKDTHGVSISKQGLHGFITRRLKKLENGPVSATSSTGSPGATQIASPKKPRNPPVVTSAPNNATEVLDKKDVPQVNDVWSGKVKL